MGMSKIRDICIATLNINMDISSFESTLNIIVHLQMVDQFGFNYIQFNGNPVSVVSSLT